MSAFSVVTEGGIAVVTFDLPGQSVNLLSTAVAEELDRVLDQLRDDPLVRAAVLISGKPDNFIAGADIEQFTRLQSQTQAEARSRAAEAMSDRVATFAKPLVAAIHGACLGGGLELALACRWRVATDHPKTQLGLPEVQLGLVPGAGGTQRLPRLIGARAALDLILTGKPARGAKLLRLGLVDELVPPSILRAVAHAAADRLAERGVSPRRAGGGLAGLVLDRTPMGRRLVYRSARKTVLGRTGGHYPAPLAAIEAVRVGLEQGMAAGLREESRRFGELAMTDVSRNLVGVFFATTALKKDDGVPGGAAIEAPAVRRLGVVGAGFMGAAIAGVAASQAEVEVRLRDSDLARVGKGLRAAVGVLDHRLARRRITRPAYRRLVALLSGAADYSGFRHADLVIEAVFEDLEVKRRVLAETEGVLGETALFATNTSTIPIADIAANARRPGRVLGMHFFSPVDRMPLLEVIPHAGTAPESVVRAVRFGRKLGKTVIVVADRPGFWVNRILIPYMNEAGLLVAEGVPIELIDRTMVRFGFPVGPATLLDEVGMDVGQKAGKVMHGAFGVRLAPPPIIDKMVADGRLGRKSGRGFYRYEGGRKAGVDSTVYRLLGVEPRAGTAPTMVEQRLVYAMLNEAARAFGEGVVRHPRDGDVGALFGIGFPAFRGGPLRMMDALGAPRVVATLRELAAAYGERFAPADALLERAETGHPFYEPA